MTDPHDTELSNILARLSEGQTSAYHELLPKIYDELRAVAHGFMVNERSGHTLQTTALVNEACMRILRLERVRWIDRAHFLRVAARAMRRVLVDYARERAAIKRGGGGLVSVSLEAVEREGASVLGLPSLDTLALDRALQRLQREYARCAQVVELVFYGGLSRTQAADLLGVSTRSVERDWKFARAWLIRELRLHGDIPATRAR